jgi:ribosomal protein L21
MKKAVIKVGGKQYVVAEKETLRVDLLPEGTKDLAVDALLVIDGDKTTVQRLAELRLRRRSSKKKLQAKRFALSATSQRSVFIKKLVIARSTR